MKKMTRILSLICVLAAMVSLFALPAFADTVDKDYYNVYISAGTWHTTNKHYKENDSKVYVYPLVSPTYYTKVQTRCYNQAGNEVNKAAAGTVSLPRETKCVITNYVYEQGYKISGVGVLMWLYMTPNSGTGTLRGKWSPDWSGNGSVSYF